MDRILPPFHEVTEEANEQALRGSHGELLTASLSSSHHPSQEGHQEQNKEYKKENLCDTRGSYGNPAKSEDRGDNGDDEKSKRPLKHFSILRRNCLTPAASMAAVSRGTP